MAFLERQLERHGDETERLHRIIVGLAQANAEQARTNRAIEAPAAEELTEDAETDARGSPGGEPRREAPGKGSRGPMPKALRRPQRAPSWAGSVGRGVA